MEGSTLADTHERSESGSHEGWAAEGEGHTEVAFVVSTRLVVGVLAGAAGAFAAIGLVTGTLHAVRGYDQWGMNALFSLSNDAAIPTWYSAAALAIASALLFITARVKQIRTEPYTRHWLALAVLFMLLSVDEVGRIHEWSGRLGDLAPGANVGVLRYSWVVVGIPFVLVLSITYARFVWALPKVTRALFVLAAVIFVGGAIGVEMLNAKEMYLVGWGRRYVAMTALEEFMEMAGVVIFIYALLGYLGPRLSEVRLRIV